MFAQIVPMTFGTKNNEFCLVRVKFRLVGWHRIFYISEASVEFIEGFRGFEK